MGENIIKGRGTRLGPDPELQGCRVGLESYRVGLVICTLCSMVLWGETGELRNGTLELWSGAGEP